MFTNAQTTSLLVAFSFVPFVFTCQVKNQNLCIVFHIQLLGHKSRGLRRPTTDWSILYQQQNNRHSNEVDPACLRKQQKYYLWQLVHLSPIGNKSTWWRKADNDWYSQTEQSWSSPKSFAWSFQRSNKQYLWFHGQMRSCITKNKAVLVLSTMRDSKLIDPDTDDERKPMIITTYNQTKYGEDILDKMCSQYDTARNTRQWPLTLFYHILNVGGLNQYKQ